MTMIERFEALLAAGKDGALLRFGLGIGVPQGRRRARGPRRTCARRSRSIRAIRRHGSCWERRSRPAIAPAAAEAYRQGIAAAESKRGQAGGAGDAGVPEAARARRRGDPSVPRGRPRSSPDGAFFSMAARPGVEQDERDAARFVLLVAPHCTRARRPRARRGGSTGRPRRRISASRRARVALPAACPGAPTVAPPSPFPRPRLRRAARCRIPRGVSMAWPKV